MKPEQVAILTSRWSAKVGERRFDHATEARVVTGDYKLDIQLHHFEQDSGIALHLSNPDRPRVVTGYEVVDEHKWAWFLLEYA